jgi:hypothetical protein
MYKLLKDKATTLLTGENIDHILFGKVNIIPYHELTKYFHIDELFKNSNAVVLVYEEKKNSGHYCALLKHDDGLIEFFDPYGTPHIDDELEFSTFNRGFIGGINSGHKISELLKRDNKKFIVNHYKFQKDAININTCGRWCCGRIRMGHLDLQTFARLFLENPIMDPDLLITAMTMLDTDF